VVPTDDAPHRAGAAPGWSESWYFDFATDAGTGGFVHLALRPRERRAWYWACLVEPGYGPVVVRDHDVVLPRAGLEIRADGLWAACVLETPLEHWSLGLEAFGVRLDDPFDAFRGELGERLPLGLDLSWEATSHAHEPGGDAVCDGAGYVQAGRVYGDVLVGDRRVDLDATGLRTHVWGDATWLRGPWSWAGASTDDGGAFSVTTFGGAASGTVWRATGVTEDIASARIGARSGEPPGEAPAPVTPVTVGDDQFDAHVVAWAPLALDGPDGRVIHLWRALCRYDGVRTSGWGWAAWMPATMEER
jgi:hypothetical protein